MEEYKERLLTWLTDQIDMCNDLVCKYVFDREFEKAYLKMKRLIEANKEERMRDEFERFV